MKKNIIFLLALVFILTSCGKEEINENVISNTKLPEEVKTMTGNIETDVVKSNDINEKAFLDNKENENSSGIINNEIQENVSSGSVSETLNYKIETEKGEKVLYLIKNGTKTKIDSTTSYLGNVIFHKDFIVYVITRSTGLPITTIFNTVTIKKVSGLVDGQWSKDKNIIYSCIEEGMMSGIIGFFDFTNMKDIDLFKDFLEKDQNSSVTACSFDDNKNEFNFSIKNSDGEKKYNYSIIDKKLNELNK